MSQEIQVTIPTLHADQAKAYEVARKNRFFALRCGRRWGKTKFESTIACNDVVRGRLVGFFAPDYKRLSETYAEIEAILAPIKRSSSQTSGIIKTVTGGQVEFWTLADESAGRSRKYHTVLIDEAAFTKPNMWDIWRRSIKPTLLDYKGRCIAASNTSGTDSDNFFWKITNEPEHGFVEYHAPSRSNPHLPSDEIDALKKGEHPLVFAQEYEAEWVDWSGVAFFSVDKLLVDGRPVPVPPRCDAVFVTIDTATKTGKENDGTGVIYWALNRVGDNFALIILDYDVVQIEGAMLETWLPVVFQNLEAFARQCNARMGSQGAWIEDKSSGMVLLQHAARKGWPAQAIDSKLTSVGKEERALAVSGYHHRGEIKISAPAFDKVVTFKGSSRNHLLSQVTGFRMGDKDPKREDDLLDCYTYGIAIALGNGEGF